MTQDRKTYNQIWEEADKNNSRYVDYTYYEGNVNNKFDYTNPLYKNITASKRAFAKESLEASENNWGVINDALKILEVNPNLVKKYEDVLSPYKTNRLYAAHYSGAHIDYNKMINDLADGKDPREILISVNEQINAAAFNGICSLYNNEFYFKTGSKMVGKNGKNYGKILDDFHRSVENGEYFIPTDLNSDFRFIEASVKGIKDNRGSNTDRSAETLFTLFNKYNQELFKPYANPNLMNKK